MRTSAPWSPPSPRALAVSLASVAVLLSASTRIARADPMSTSPEQAYDLGTMPGARATAMGGALNALGVSTTALALNPANMSLARVYHLEAFGALGPESRRQTYGLAIVDSVLNASHIAGGLAGTWSQLDPDGIHRTWTDLRAASSFPIGDHLSLGSTIRWLRVEQNVGTGPFGASFASGGTHDGPVFNALTFDAGLTGVLGDFRVAVVGHNLTNPATALAPTTGAAGIGYATPVFALELDGLADFTTWSGTRGRIMAGAELFLLDHYAVRGGWRYDAGMNVHTPSFGFGYIDPRWSIELAVSHDAVSEHAGTMAVLALRYFYDPSGSGNTTDDPDGIGQ